MAVLAFNPQLDFFHRAMEEMAALILCVNGVWILVHEN